LLIVLAAAAGEQLEGSWRESAQLLDYGAALRLRALASPWIGLPLQFLSWIGEAVPMALATGSLFVYLLRRRCYASALFAGISMPGTAIMWKVTSLLVERPRPNYWTMHDPADLGYPGGHVMNAVVIAGVCLFLTLPRLKSRWQQAGAILFGVLFVIGTGMSRIYVNAHFLTDNIAGFLMGLLWVLIALPLCRWAFPECQDQPQEGVQAFRKRRIGELASWQSAGRQLTHRWPNA
jgi:undecaprenyl-diphosphatase